ncbi:hypothetical protein [Pannonibacter tanglangensis]|uniref:Uncharacterized protein n=1 Tax=Pannonibacter tanglangensis TaxID=2750084 RepID=A0ABW9ZGB3_9HYPH|nr:hypothetical protein [Pannonibacter sp. XCT-34]NBN63022.1 hypothetical protein [Pannonibacter sp. XCT-34]
MAPRALTLALVLVPGLALTLAPQTARASEVQGGVALRQAPSAPAIEAEDGVKGLAMRQPLTGSCDCATPGEDDSGGEAHREDETGGTATGDDDTGGTVAADEASEHAGRAWRKPLPTGPDEAPDMAPRTRPDGGQVPQEPDLPLEEPLIVPFDGPREASA